jgi:hypothetical protein
LGHLCKSFIKTFTLEARLPVVGEDVMLLEL